MNLCTDECTLCIFILHLLPQITQNLLTFPEFSAGFVPLAFCGSFGSVGLPLPLLRGLGRSCAPLRALLVELDELQQVLHSLGVLLSASQLLHRRLQAAVGQREQARAVDVGPQEGLPAGLLPGRGEQLLPHVQLGVVVGPDALHGFAQAQVGEVFAHRLLYAGAGVGGGVGPSLAQGRVKGGHERLVLGHDGTPALGGHGPAGSRRFTNTNTNINIRKKISTT